MFYDNMTERFKLGSGIAFIRRNIELCFILIINKYDQNKYHHVKLLII